MRRSTKRILGGLVGLLFFLIGGICFGFDAAYCPEVEYIEVPVEAPVIVEEEVIVEIPVPMELREFASQKELKEWLDQDNTEGALYFSGSIDFSGYYDCDDYAIALMRNALEDGYLMSTEIIRKGSEFHMINSTIIGNNVYFIEPETNEIWLAYRRD